ncbi:C39 family peptidase [Paenibacillus thailandensis]|uniref:C39 family peptidase n=1 Tax=Paenibacillus thailandensis TaxID=393250 RepID=A0ABW5QZR1_9BACL
MSNIVYYSQEDSRWRNILYSIRNDKTQTIGTSACGPTCAAMAISSLTGKELLPPAAAAYAVENGYRTANSGTAWGFFSSIAKQYGLEVIQTGSLDQVLVALAAGKLVVASMRPGHFTGGGHFILLVDVNQSDGVNWIDVYDPNHDNTKYGADGLVDQGVRNDGKVTAKESVFRKEAGQYWIFDKPEEEGEEEMDKAIVYVNGKKIADGLFDNKAGVTYVPVRAVVESFGASVKWDGKQKRVDITK